MNIYKRRQQFPFEKRIDRMATNDEINVKTALITGASSGIGLQLARLFAQDGYRLVLVSRTETDLQQIADDLVDDYQCFQPIVIAKDLSRPGAAQELFNHTERLSLQIDYLVNDAGMGEWGLFNDTPLEKLEAMIITNVVSFMQLTKFYLSGMLKRNEGRILQVTSLLGFIPAPLLAIYGATKAFQANFTDALINEIKHSKVTITQLVPGMTDTAFYTKDNGINETRASEMVKTIGDDPKDVAYNGYTSLMKGEHRVYGSTKVKLLYGAGYMLPNDLLTCANRSLLEQKHS